jgi:hypothetical protein
MSPASTTSTWNTEGFLMHGGGIDKAFMRSARDMESFRQMLNEYRVELCRSMANVDEDAGLPPGTFEKLTAGVNNYRPANLGPVLDALGIEIALMPTGAGTEGKIDDRQEPVSNLKTLQANAPLGGRIRRAMMTKPEWSKFCRRAAKARWSKVRKNAKLAAAFNPRAVVEGAV